jgi:hypothetical protein
MKILKNKKKKFKQLKSFDWSKLLCKLNDKFDIENFFEWVVLMMNKMKVMKELELLE